MTDPIDSPADGHALQIVPPTDEPIFVRRENFIVFNQFGAKLKLDRDLPIPAYFRWLDKITEDIGELVPGAQIAEKDYARANPRLNTGVYYDTPDRDLLRIGAVLRTTCNKITHAFCAFKEPENAVGVRRDHRHVFDGDEKLAIQTDPTSDESRHAVERLLSRNDIEHPGVHLRSRYGIDPATLLPSIQVAQMRHPFFVWLDGRDALRCVMDRAIVRDLRIDEPNPPKRWFQELELPVYPRIDPEIARDPRTIRLIQVLSSWAERDIAAVLTTDNKYQRAATELGLRP